MNMSDFKVYFDAIATKGFSVKELSDSKIKQMDKKLSAGKTEEEVMNSALASMKELSGEDTSEFDNFATAMKFSRQGHKVVVAPTSTCTTLV
jgi:hypothetical protein